MDARCPLCTTVFKTDRVGVQFCPNCGQQVNVADVAGAPQPPPTGPAGAGPGPQFFPPSGGGSAPPPPSPTFGRGPTAWEQRSERGFFPALLETWKSTMFDAPKFFSTAEPATRVWDAILYSWIIFTLSQLISLPFRLMGLDRPEAPKNLDDLPPQMQELFKKVFASLEQQSGTLGTIGGSVAAIIFFPLLMIISAAILHLFCMMFGASKNGFSATLRASAYAYSPALFMFWIFSCASLPYSLVLTIIGISKMQETDAGRATGAVLTPLFVTCCCCCGGLLLATMSLAGAAANMK